MSDASWALQQAIYAALSGDTGLLNLLNQQPRIYDHVPDEVIYPYLVIGECKTTDWGHLPNGLQHDVKFYAYSRYAGRREIKDVMSAVYDVLHENNLSIPNICVVNARYTFGDVWRRQDSDTYQAIMRYKYITHTE